MRTLKRLLYLVITGVFLFTGWVAYRVNSPVQFPSLPYEFSIKPGSSLKSVANQLASAGVLHDAWSFILLSRLTGVASSLKAGDYEITASTSPLELLKRITKGDISQSEIRFIEGWNFSQLRQTLDQHPSVRHDTTALSNGEIMKLIDAEVRGSALIVPRW